MKPQSRAKMKELRMKAGLTQEDMAQKTGIERTKYTRIENGSLKNVYVNDAYLIAKALKSSIEELFALRCVYQKHKDSKEKAS